MNVTMHHILIMAKSTLALFIVWFTDLFVLSFASLSIISPDIREFLIDFKEIISILVSLSILVLTIIKIVKVSKDKKDIDEK